MDSSNAFMKQIYLAAMLAKQIEQAKTDPKAPWPRAISIPEQRMFIATSDYIPASVKDEKQWIRQFAYAALMDCARRYLVMDLEKTDSQWVFTPNKESEELREKQVQSLPMWPIEGMENAKCVTATSMDDAFDKIKGLAEGQNDAQYGDGDE